MRSIDSATRAAIAEIKQLIADNWREVDMLNTESSPSFFTEDCVFEPGTGEVFKGREGIRAFYDNRALRGKRTTRHNPHNIRVRLEGPNRAKVDYIIAHYAADGEAPIIDYLGPAAVMNVDVVCERDGEGVWRFASVRGSAAFVSHEPYVREALVRSPA